MKATVKKIQEAVGVDADGIFGPLTTAAVADKLRTDRTLRAIQKAVGADVDGIFGKQTAAFIKTALGLGWPSQAEVRSGDSVFGKAGREENLVSIKPAYQLYYDGHPVKTIRVHKLIAKAVSAALEEVLDEYGQERIHELGLDNYGGSYNNRTTASGRSLSMHAWGIALDFYPERNTYEMRKPYASLSRPECRAWWEIWERHGAVSLGRERDYDWMHLQFATL